GNWRHWVREGGYGAEGGSFTCFGAQRRPATSRALNEAHDSRDEVIRGHGEAHGVHCPPCEALGDLRQQGLVVAETHRDRPLERQDPWPISCCRQHVVDEQCGTLRHFKR